MRFRRHTVFPLVLLAASLLGGCVVERVPRPAMNAWPAGEMTQLTDLTPRFDDHTILDDRKSVSLFAASNEAVSFQIVVDAGNERIAGLRIGCDGLTGPAGAKIPADQVTAFRMLPVQVTEFPAWFLRLCQADAIPCGYYDALAPIAAPVGGQPFACEPRKRLAFWLDLSVPRTAPPGLYTGSLRLTSDTHADLYVPVALQVYAFMLPDLRPIGAIGGFDHRTIYRTFVTRDGQPYLPVRMDRSNPQVRQGLGILRQMMVLAHEHRLDLFEKEIRPALRREASGRVNLDWEDYDNVVTPYLKGGAFDDKIGVPAWASPLCQDWPEPDNYGGPGSDADNALAAEIADQCRRHFQALAVNDQVFHWPYRGEVNGAAFGRHSRLARLVRSTDPQTPILAALPTSAPAQAGWAVPKDFAAGVDIVAPPAQWLDPTLGRPKLARRDSPLRGVWLSPGLPPYLPGLSVASGPADVRAIAWFAMKYQCSGIFLPEVLNWAGDIFNSPAGAETRLFYPGKPVGIDGVLPSVRLKHLRRGLQDLAYLWILRQRQRGAIADVVLGSMVRYAGLEAAGDHYLDPRLEGYVHDGAAWERARRLLAEEIVSAIQDESTPNSRLLAQRVAWKELDERVHAVRPEQIRATVRPIAGKGDLTMTVLVELFNEFSRDSQVLVKIENLPDGWKAQAGEAALVMPGCARAAVTLTAQGTHVPALGNGKMPVYLSITSDMRRRQDLVAAVPFLLAGRATTPPTIDGLLDDWPLREGNTAGEFKALGRRGNIDEGLAKRQTLAFVTYDGRNLYLAIRCDEPDVGAITAKATNVIRYEQLMACGEDLVEVILDPGASAKSAEGLYHILVKCNGVLLTEKGIHTDPPLGKASAWPANATVAVKKLEKEKIWVVEMAIPLSSFGEGALPGLWGVNFTRFSSQGMEASSWSGAGRYFYDPRNLGTMLIVPEGTTTK